MTVSSALWLTSQVRRDDDDGGGGGGEFLKMVVITLISGYEAIAFNHANPVMVFDEFLRPASNMVKEL